MSPDEKRIASALKMAQRQVEKARTREPENSRASTGLPVWVVETLIEAVNQREVRSGLHTWRTSDHQARP